MTGILLQRAALGLDNGQQGVFVGAPLVAGNGDEDDGQIEDIWFSDVQGMPGAHQRFAAPQTDPGPVVSL